MLVNKSCETIHQNSFIEHAMLPVTLRGVHGFNAQWKILERAQVISSCAKTWQVVEYGFSLEVCTGMGTAGIPRNPRFSRGCGYECCRNTAGMDLTIAGFPRGWILLRRKPRGNGGRINWL